MENTEKLQPGDPAPDFTLKNQNDEETTLSDFRGKPVVLYFYPKDNTPGCTTEACDFRDNHSELKKLGVEILGVSPDSVKKHVNFIEKYNLPFTLLSNPEKDVLKTYGAYGIKKMYGKETEGVIRSTYIIDSEGRIYKSWRNIRVKGHVDKVTEQVKKLVS